MPNTAVVLKRLLLLGFVIYILWSWLGLGSRTYKAKYEYSNYYKGLYKEKKRQDLQPVIVYRGSDVIANISDLNLVKTKEEKDALEHGYLMYAFNVIVSERLGRIREIPDTRHKTCEDLNYKLASLPDASVVICFYNEEFHTLIRTIYSVLERSPSHLLKEIILVNDHSNNGIENKLQDFLYSEPELSKVHLFNMDRRLGLIRARIYGAKKASGRVLVFLDSHVECNVDWLPPLLQRIHESTSNVVTPIIDAIDPDTFEYKPSPLVRGGFNWGMNFKWENLPPGTLDSEEKFSQPIMSPTMAGGLFAIDRQLFHALGEYDEGLEIWGGENLEISFRIWQCGGRLDIIPCSRVGHVFRKRRPYSSQDKNGEDTQVKNAARVARVWLDDHIKYFYETVPGAESVAVGDLTQRLELKKRLGCQSFAWYLANVFPELRLPGQEKSEAEKQNQGVKFQRWDQRQRNYTDSFQLVHANDGLCVAPETGIVTKGSYLMVKACYASREQSWFTTVLNELVLSKLLCLDSQKGLARLVKCTEMGSSQQWIVTSSRDKSSPGKIYNKASGQCLVAKDNYLEVDLCEDAEVWYRGKLPQHLSLK